MWPFHRSTLRTDLIEILQDSPRPLTLEQLTQQLFFKRQKVSDLIVLSSASVRKKQKLKRKIELILQNLDVDKIELGTEACSYLLRRPETRPEPLASSR